MANKLTKIFNTKKSKLFWLYIVVGFLIVIAAAALMPFWASVAPDLFFSYWGWGFLKIVVAVALLIYAFGYLLKNAIKSSRGVIKVLTFIEFAIFIIIALGSVISQFNIISLSSCQILGFAIWTRGSIEVIRAYYYRGGEVKYPLYQVLLAIVLITFGAYLFISNVISDELILWVVTSVLELVGILAIIFGFLKNPRKKSKKEKVS